MVHTTVMRATAICATVLHARVLYARVVRAAVVRATVVRATVVRATVVRATVVCTTVVRATVVRATVVRATVGQSVACTAPRITGGPHDRGGGLAAATVTRRAPALKSARAVRARMARVVSQVSPSGFTGSHVAVLQCTPSNEGICGGAATRCGRCAELASPALAWPQRSVIA